MQALICGRYRAEISRAEPVRDAALGLRAQVFRGGADDRDAFDARCDHITVTDVTSGRVEACARVMQLQSGARIHLSYAAQSYDLEQISQLSFPMLELGRFCVHPGSGEPDILRAIWALLTRLVDETGVRLLFGCASFPGVGVDDKMDALAYLARKHLAPAGMRPGARGDQIIRLEDMPDGRGPGLNGIPPLLRSYLSMGAWVSDHAVIDPDLDTLHVFTGLEIDAIPPRRKKLLRALAGVDVAGLGA